MRIAEGSGLVRLTLRAQERRQQPGKIDYVDGVRLSAEAER